MGKTIIIIKLTTKVVDERVNMKTKTKKAPIIIINNNNIIILTRTELIHIRVLEHDSESSLIINHYSLSL